MYKATLHPVDGYVRALCCECGEVRLIPAGYRGRRDKHWDAEGGPNKTRCVVDVQCKHCSTLTRHAWLRDHDPYADYAEWTQEERLNRAMRKH